MDNQLIVGMPPAVMDLIQQGALEREFHDSLFPALMYRQEALTEEWDANSGMDIVMTRAGLLPPVVKPTPIGADPIPQDPPAEQWTMSLGQFKGATDINMVTSSVALANLMMRKLQQLGLQAGQSINRVPRNTLFSSYLAGNSLVTAAIAGTETALHVSSLNGFTDVLIPFGDSIRPVPVSPASPLPVSIGSTTVVVKNVIGTVADDPSDPLGPGTVILSSAVGTAFAGPRTPIVSKYAARVSRSSVGNSIDSITAGDALTLQQVINAAGRLREANVPVHDDGFYHFHLSNPGNDQIYADPVFQRLNTALPQGVQYRTGYVGHTNGVLFFVNNESPTTYNSGTLVPTGTGSGAGQLAQYSPELNSEVVNGAGVPIGFGILTGKGALYERYLDEANYVTEAGLNGKIGEFDVVNGGVSIKTEHIRLILRAPVDRLQQNMSAAWSITTGFACPSDILAPSGPQRFKRAIVLQHAAG